MGRLRSWILCCSVLFWASSPALAGIAVIPQPDCLPVSVIIALEESGLIPPGSGQGTGGGGTGGTQVQGGVTGPGIDSNGQGYDGLPWYWTADDHTFPWYVNGELLPACPPDGNEGTFTSGPFGPASLFSVTIDDPEDPFSTPFPLQDVVGQVNSMGSDFVWVNINNVTNAWSSTVDLEGTDFEVEDVPLVIGSNTIVVWAVNDEGEIALDTVEVIHDDDYCAARQGNVICTESWCDGTDPIGKIEHSHGPWLQEHPDGIGVLYPIHGDFPQATNLPPPPAEPLDAALTYSVFEENGQAKLRFHAELRSFDSLPTPFKLSEVAVQVTASSENGDTTLVLDPFCYDQAQGFYDAHGQVFGYVDAILPFDGSNNGAPTTVTATLIGVDGSGDPIQPMTPIGRDRTTFIPNDNPIALTDPVPNGLVAQINNSGLNVVDGLFAGQVSTLVKDGLANPPPNGQVTIQTLGVGSVGFQLEESNIGFTPGEFGSLTPTVSLKNLFGFFTVSGIGCDILFSVSSATVSVSFDQVPASDPHQVNLVPKAYSNSIADDLDTEEDWTLGCLLVDGDDAATAVINGILDAIRKEIEPALEQNLNGLGLGQLVGDLLQVDFDGTFSSIDDHAGLARYNVDSHFQSTTGGTLVSQSFAPPDGFAPFGPTAPSGGNFDLGVYLTPAGLNQLLAARTNDGLLTSEITELTAGDPLEVQDLGFIPFPAGTDPTDKVVLSITPTMAPMTNGQPGPNGEMYQLDIWQLNMSAIWTDGQGVETEVLRVLVDLSLGLDVGFAGPGAPPSTTLSPIGSNVEVLYNPYGANDFIVELTVGVFLSQNFGALLGADLFGDGGGGPIGFLGLDVNGQEALRAGDAMALLFDLKVAPTQAIIAVDQDGIEDISVDFDVTFPFDGVSFAWDFDDGDTQTTTSPSVSHIFGGLPGAGGLPPGLHEFGITVDVTRTNGAVVSGAAAIAICIKENPFDVCEM